MTVADVDKIVSNGGDLSAVNSSGYRPISMACKSGTNVDVIKQMIQNGANSYDCSLYDFFIYTTKNPYDRSVILKNIEDLINAGVEPTVLAEETILESMFFNPETVISLFKKYDGYPCYRLYRLAVSATGFDCEQKVPNSYVSLVMTEEDFLKINQDIDWDKYMS